MASGESLDKREGHDGNPSGVQYPVPDFRNRHPVMDFDATEDAEIEYTLRMPSNYANGGLTLFVDFSMSSAETGDVVIGASFERIGDEIQDSDTDSFAPEQSVTVVVPATSGHVKTTSILFTNGAQMDDIVAGERYRLKFRRVGLDASDTAAGDLELWGWELQET